MYQSASSGCLVCCACKLDTVNREDVHFHKYSEVLNHIKEHEKIGDFVPKYAVDLLKKEQNEFGDDLDLEE